MNSPAPRPRGPIQDERRFADPIDKLGQAVLEGAIKQYQFDGYIAMYAGKQFPKPLRRFARLFCRRGDPQKREA